MQPKSYRVVQEGWVLGTFREEGETITATEAEAKYIVLAGSIEEVTDQSEAADLTDA